MVVVAEAEEARGKKVVADPKASCWLPYEKHHRMRLR